MVLIQDGNSPHNDDKLVCVIGDRVEKIMQLFNNEKAKQKDNSKLRDLFDISSEEKTRILNATHELFTYYNLDLEIIWANKAAAESLNLEPEGLIGRYCFELWGQSDSPCENCPVLRAKETGEPHEIEKQTPDGRYWSIRGYPLFDEHGNITHLVEYSREISSQKKYDKALKESEQRFRLVATSSTDVIYEWDLETNTLNWFGNEHELFDKFTPPRTMDGFKSYVHPDNQQRVILRARKGIENHEAWAGNYAFLLPDDTVKLVHGSGAAVYDEQGNPLKVYGSVTNVTKQKKTEIALRESEQRYRSLIDQMPQSVLIMKDKKYIFANPSGARLLGYEHAEDIKGVSVLDTIHPDSIPKIHQRIMNAEKGIPNPTTEIKIIRKDERIIDVETSSIPIIINEEPITLIIGQDITQEKRLQRKEKQYQVQLQKLNDNLLEMLELPSIDSLYEYIGKTLSEMIHNAIIIVGEINDEKEIILIKNIFGLKHQFLRKIFQKIGADPVGKEFDFKDYLKNVYQKQMIFKYPGGLKEFSHGYYNGTVLDKVERLIGINEIYTIGLRRKNKLFSAIHIITFGKGSLENKELLETFLNQSSVALRRKMLEKENVQLANVVRQSDDAIIQTDKKFQITYMNAKAEELFGYSFSEIKGNTPALFNASKQKDEFQNQIYSTVQHGETFFGDCLNKRKNGSLFWCQMKISQIYNEEQNITGYMSFARDITDKKNAEQKIKETNEKIQKIIDSSPSGICVVDKKGIIETWSPACETIFGWSADEVIGRFNPTVLNDKKDYYFETIKRRATNVEQKALTKNKGWVEISLSSVPLQENGEFVGALGVMTNITEHKKIERKIQESERKYRTLFDTMAQGVVYQNRDGYITSANPAAERILGFSLEQMQNMKSLDSRWEAIRENGSEFPGAEHPAMIALKTGKITKDVMGVFNPKENEYKWIQVTAIPEFTEGQDRYQTYTSFEDITELKKTQDMLAKSEKDYRILFEEQVNGFAICQSVFSNEGDFVSFRFSEINPAYERILNLKRQDVLGKDVKEVFPGTEQEWIEKLGSVAINGEPQIFEMFHQPTNKYYYCNVYRPWNTSDRFCIIFNDVTNRKNAEKNFREAHYELKELNKTLEEKVKLRTKEINLLLKHKDEFIHQLGHDLKNPLGPLINLLPILQRGEKDTRRQEMFTVINRNVGYMKNLVTKTLELARLNSPNTQFSFESTNLSRKVDEIIETNKLTFKQQNIIVKNLIPSHLTVAADSLRLSEVFTNVVNNAVKYTPHDGIITINATEDEHKVTVSVTDTGIGMTQDQIDHMFDEFYKADPSRHDFDSSGLGMSISKRIVEKHGGKIWAESPGPGKGSTFYFSLPKEKRDT